MDMTKKKGPTIKNWTFNILSITDEQLKEESTECTHQYIERIQLNSQQSGSDTSETNESSEQANLNKIIASLAFD